MSDEPQSLGACERQQRACERLYLERNARHNTEIKAIGDNVNAALLAIKRLVEDIRKEAISAPVIKQIIDEKIQLALSSSSCKDRIIETIDTGEVGKIINEKVVTALSDPKVLDITKGTVALPVLVSVLVTTFIVASVWFTFKASIEKDVQANTRTIEKIERYIERGNK